jgi:hypothetical protein
MLASEPHTLMGNIRLSDNTKGEISMGMIRILVEGSFDPHDDKIFSAMKEGHAKTVADAIKWLAEDVLPKAIQNDHKCQQDGEYPENRFGLRH